MSELDAVIKIGGELILDEETCRSLLKELYKNILTGRRLLVISGGGVLSDHIRELYRKRVISDEAAHWMAVLSMDQSAHILAEKDLNIKLVRNPIEAEQAAESRHLPVMLVYNYLRLNDNLPHNWSVTSDSIAAYIAFKTKTRFLILVKNVDGLYPTPEIREDNLIPAIKASFLNPDKHKIVDSYLREILCLKPDYKCWLINAYHPERLTELLKTGVTFGTEIII